MSSILEIVEQAIAQRRRLLIRYGGQGRARVVEPHLLYRGSSGRRTLVAYQTRGYSAGGRPPPFWRPFRVSRIDEIYPLSEYFEPRLERGFATVSALVRGEVMATVSEADVCVLDSGAPVVETVAEDVAEITHVPEAGDLPAPSAFSWRGERPVMRVMKAIRASLP